MATRRTIGFITCHELGGIVPDDRLIATELGAHSVDVIGVPWDAVQTPPRVDAFVIRSPWNYHLQPDAFMQWIERAATIAPLYNDPAIVRWNAHKQYLFDLEAAGVNIAPTVLCRSAERHDLDTIMRERNWHEVIVKPAVSASSYMTAIVGATPHPALQVDELKSRFISDGQTHLETILQTRDALVQPFLPEIFTRGERSLVYLDGVYSHCVQKDAFTTGPGGGHRADADDEERAIAERALATLPLRPLYARVDLLRNADGAEHLMELELIDPELYMRYDAQAPRRFAETLVRLLP
ncbi:MAG: hypothetical protein JO322_09455 [Candidatus Eremiobacteraeota bacterium]|nr:hypothetical protein [Candidatus Eremiobacteraeota bacterium]